MKVLKVNHSRPGVGRKNQSTDDVHGFIYQFPNRNPNSRINAERMLSSRNRSIKILYNVFVPVQAGTAPTEPDKDMDPEKYIWKKSQYDTKKKNYERRAKCEKVIPQINRTIKELFFNNETVNSEDSILQKMSSRSVGNIDPEELVTLALRSSLQHVKADAVVFLSCLGKETISDKDEECIRHFLKAVKEDYLKLDDQTAGSFSADIIRSIENQNTLMQSGNAGSIALSIPNSQNKKTTYKETEKTGFAQFLEDYAVLDEAARMTRLSKIRNLLELYFTSPDRSPEDVKADFKTVMESKNVWIRHSDGKADCTDFATMEGLDELKEKQAMDQVRRKNLLAQLNTAIRTSNIAHYRYARKIVEDSNGELFFEDYNQNMFWIHHIENAIERILQMDKKKRKTYTLKDNLYKLQVGYLREKVWKDILNAISIKYVGYGKAIFNFAMDDMQKMQDMKLGVLKDNVRMLNSFDYEAIKARETFQRELAVFVAFASNNLARAALDMDRAGDKSDMLLMNQEDVHELRRAKEDEKTIRHILQFFGGSSTWKDDMGMFPENYPESTADNLLMDLKNALYALRNECFHFASARKNIAISGSGQKLISSMFAKEVRDCAVVEKNKFYSNNLPMFYGQTDFQKVLILLYSSYHERKSQVPAFNNVLPRSHVAAFLGDVLKINVTDTIKSPEILEQWHSACFYLLKEIYYNDFLASDAAKAAFIDAVKQLKPDTTRDDVETQKRAIVDFSRRINDIENGRSLSEICQVIMTDYNQQNNQTRRVRSSKDSLFDVDIYKHYVFLLHESLTNALGAYINNKADYDFIKTVHIYEKPALEKFLPDYRSRQYDDLIEKIQQPKNLELQIWYIAGRFMTTRMLNQMAGSMRSYIQFAEDVTKRARTTQNALHVNLDAHVASVRKALEVIDICIKLSGTFSNEFTDYFESKEDYKVYLEKYICGSLSDLPVGIYTDGTNEIVNRNVLLAKLYSPEGILAALVDVTDKDIKAFLKAKQEAADFIAKDQKTREEQEKVLAYQKLKNKIELRNVTDYAEIINELLGQLINWAFLRERDMLYYQLGFHYMCLQNNSEKPASYSTLTLKREGKEYNADGAILRQIAGIYINGIGIINALDGKEYFRNGSVGAKLTGYKRNSIDAGSFCGYSQAMFPDKDMYYLYNAGLEVFENLNEHDTIARFRNSIDHFKYYTGNAGSILDYYSRVFDCFFSYDMKYQKNVLNQLDNILLRHNVIAEFGIGSQSKTMDSGKEKEAAKLYIRKLSSNKYTYPIKEGKLEADAVDGEFLKTVGRILYYPEELSDKCKIEAGASKVAGKAETKENSRSDNGNRAKGSQGGQGNRHAGKQGGQGNRQGNNRRGNNNRNNRDKGGNHDHISGGSAGTSMGDLLKGFKLGK